jgi:glycosyltransferase involved in cell wall biosynthesis
MHVLYFHQHFSTPEGSAGTRSFEMARQLVAEGHSVTMVCGSYRQGKTGLEGPFRRGRRRGLVSGIDVVEFDLSYSNEQGFLRRAALFVRFALSSVWLALRERYDLAFATSTPLTAGIPGIAARWLRRKPFVFEVRDLWPELPRAMGVITNPLLLGAMSLLEWASYRSASRCVALSPGIAQGIQRRGVPPDRISIIPNGSDLDLFGASAPAQPPPGTADGDLVAIYSGTHGLANGLDAVLDAAAVLRARGREDIRFVLIGQGSEKARLRARAGEEGLENVLFLDPLPKRQLAGLLRGADVGLQTLRNVPAFYYGTSPNKFFDYLAAGLPVLNNYPGWLAGMIRDKDCGFAVPPDSPQAFAEALEQAASDRVRLRAMGQNARRLAVEEFDRARLAGLWVGWVTAGRQRLEPPVAAAEFI